MIFTTVLTKFFFLLFAHALADYSLQTDFIATGKNRHTPNPHVPWYYIMVAHCMLHAGFVTMFTGSLWLGVAEFLLHFLLDVLKCEGKTNIHVDQGGHVACKLLWAIL